MDNKYRLEKFIKDLKQEELDLKTKQNIAGLARSYYYSFTPQSVQDRTITYANGNQPIITQVYTEGTVTLGVVNGNTQKMFFYAQAPVEVKLVSTRPILSVA